MICIYLYELVVCSTLTPSDMKVKEEGLKSKKMLTTNAAVHLKMKLQSLEQELTAMLKKNKPSNSNISI